jgi:hypothetical protein
LAEKLLDEPNACIGLLAGAAFFSSLCHADPASILLKIHGALEQNPSLPAVRGITSERFGRLAGLAPF